MEDPIELAPHLFFIPGENRGRFPYAHSLFIDGEVRALIDTGAGEGLTKLSQKTIDVVILSHFHPDHVKEMQQFSEAEFWTHPASAPPLLSMEDFLLYTGLENLGEDWEAKYPLEVSFLPKIHYHYQDGEVLDFGGVCLTVLHLPGHSPGHTALYHEKEGLLFSGDIDLTGFGPWYGYPSSDIRTFLESIHRVKELAPRTLISSHKGMIKENIEEELEAYERVIFSREERILQLLATHSTLKRVQDEAIIYGELSREMELLYYFEGIFLEKHLEYLFYRGKVRREGDLYVPI